MARRLFREWFVHFRYPGHESVPLVESPLGRIPQGWDVRTIGSLCDRVTDGAHLSPKSVDAGLPMASSMGHATITTTTIYTRLAIRYEVEARHWIRGQIQLLDGQTCPVRMPTTPST